MKRYFCAAAAVILCLLCLVSCAVKFEYVDGQLVNGKTKEKYNALPIGFEPCGVGEAYGEFGAFALYEVVDHNGNTLDPEAWLTEEYAGNATTVFLNEETPVPSVKDMKFDVCYFCEEDANVIALAAIEDEEEISAIISALEGETADVLKATASKATYTLKLYSEEYPAVYYSLNYHITEKGNFLYDRGRDIYVEIGDMLSEYAVAEDE